MFVSVVPVNRLSAGFEHSEILAKKAMEMGQDTITQAMNLCVVMYSRYSYSAAANPINQLQNQIIAELAQLLQRIASRVVEARMRWSKVMVPS